jgi:hypothetical protein
MPFEIKCAINILHLNGLFIQYVSATLSRIVPSVIFLVDGSTRLLRSGASTGWPTDSSTGLSSYHTVLSCRDVVRAVEFWISRSMACQIQLGFYVPLCMKAVSPLCVSLSECMHTLNVLNVWYLQ